VPAHGGPAPEVPTAGTALDGRRAAALLRWAPMTRKLLQGAFLLVLTAVLSVSALFGASAMKWAAELPSLEGLDALEFTATSLVYARDGTQIGQIVPVVGEDRESTNRIPVGLDEISPAALQAIVAYEDFDFFHHFGFNPLSVARAFYEEFLGDADRGGSTITTQVVKNTVLYDLRSDRSMERKAKELMLAIELERRLTKAEILQRYVNVVFWGGNVYGIRAAAQTYFGKEPSELNLAEGLYLARLIPAPNVRHDDFSGSRASMREVLNRMVRQGTISQRAADLAWRYPLQPRGWSVRYDAQGNVLEAVRTGEEVLVQSSVSSDLSRHVLFEVRRFLLSRFGEAVVFGQGGLRVHTTVDVQAQRAANEAAQRAEVPEGAQMAIVALDHETGAILAMVGEKLRPGVPPGEFNRATQARRQPGSSFKPIVYATAIESGGLHQSTVLVDAPSTFLQRGQPVWEPRNWDNTFAGPLTVRENLNQSRNIPAVKALEAASAQAVADRARELGYNIEPYYSIALGTFEVTPLAHASAFGAFANGGEQVEAHLVTRVEDADGNVLYEAQPRRKQVWSPQTAYIMLDTLHGNIVDRNPTALSWRVDVPGRWVTGKTGTTNDDRDIWFVGATPGMTALVWMGRDDAASMGRTMTNSDGTRETVTSSRQPIYVWNDFVRSALQGRPSTSDGFPVPEGIVFHTIDRRTGAITPNGTRAAFSAATDVTTQGVGTSLTIQLAVDRRDGRRATADTPWEFVDVIDVLPSELDQYLGGGPALGPQRNP
jgi:penicillin-binding protein 1A